MNGRRRHRRYRLSTPLDGHLRLRDEVSIEKWDDREIEVLSTLPGRPHERLVLELTGGGVDSLGVEVVECAPVILADGSLCHRIRLMPTTQDDPAGPSDREGADGE